MPGSATAIHPRTGRVLTFTEHDHVYRDDQGQRYTSGTAVVKRCFPKFDAVAVSERIAARDGLDAAALRAEWKAKGAAACEFGTRVHENCEAQLTGAALIHAPRDERERAVMTHAYHAAADLLTHYTVLAVELIVFSPGCYVAGTIDALLLARDGSRYLIADWKTNAKLRTTAFNDEMGIGPARALPHCHLSHYALQLSLYQQILVREGYVTPGVPIDRRLIHVTPDGATHRPVPFHRAESAEALLDAATAQNNEVPF